MATQKLGTLIKDARTKANLTQEKLAAKIAGVSANDISKMERGELVPTQDVLKKIAKITGVTQASLIEASKASTSAAKKPAASSAKTSSAAKKPAASSAKTSSAAKKPTTSSAKTSSAGKTGTSSSTGTSVKLTAAEKKLVEAYRKADAQTKKAAMKVLNGESNSILDTILGTGASSSLGDAASSLTENLVGGLVNSLLGNLGK